VYICENVAHLSPSSPNPAQRQIRKMAKFGSTSFTWVVLLIGSMRSGISRLFMFSTLCRQIPLGFHHFWHHSVVSNRALQFSLTVIDLLQHALLIQRFPLSWFEFAWKHMFRSIRSLFDHFFLHWMRMCEAGSMWTQPLHSDIGWHGWHERSSHFIHSIQLQISIGISLLHLCRVFWCMCWSVSHHISRYWCLDLHRDTSIHGHIGHSRITTNARIKV